MDKVPTVERPQPILCYVTDRRTLGAADSVDRLLETVRAARAAGVDWVQIREKDLTARALFQLALEAVHVASSAGGRTRVIVNDRLDVALAAGADGVHLGRESLPVHDVVPWCRGGNAPDGFLIGVSCHSIEEARQSEDAGASYIFFGPVFDTPAKRVFGPPQGMAQLVKACRNVRIPVLAIGGVDAENAAGCIRAGVAGIAAIRLFQDARDAATLKEAIARVRRDAAT
jgi:thiamine-phosphate pyrophosphorylase